MSSPPLRGSAEWSAKREVEVLLGLTRGNHYAAQHPQPHVPFGHGRAVRPERSAHGESALLFAQLCNRRIAPHGR